EILQLLTSSNPLTCPLDPIPSTLFQTITRDLLPFISVIINNSLSSGYVPTAFKTSRVVPILKKATLDSSSITNYRPWSHSSSWVLQGPEVGHQHQRYHQENPAEDVLPASDEEVQPTLGADGPVQHCHKESVITISIIVWGSSATKHYNHRLQHIIRSAEKTIGVKLLTLLDLLTSRIRRQVEKITADPSHHGHHLFQHLPSGWHFSQMRIMTSQLQGRLFSYAIKLMNS
ncbi:hypothetical protein P4O66_010108, partial [Electrophorus voltai]